MEYQELDKVRKFLETVNRRKIQHNHDRIILVVGDEGVGKSTFMVQSMWLWEEIRGREPTPDSVLENVVWGEREAFKQQLLSADSGDIISVQDAAHVLFRKEAMHGEQIEIEKALLDIRIENYLILMGFQDWSDVPDGLQRRRAKNVFRIPSRGKVLGYNRSSLDEKYSDCGKGEWPDPDFEDRFPSLEGTTLWERYEERDAEQKRARLQDSQQQDIEDATKEEQIKIALRAVKPWADDRGMTQAKAAELTDYSQAWVSDKVQNWRKGAYRDLVDENDDANRVTAKS